MKTRKKIFEFIVNYKCAHDGQSPTVREIADGLNIPSTSVVHFHLRKLEELGTIEITAGQSRGIRVPGGRWVYGVVEVARPMPVDYSEVT